MAQDTGYAKGDKYGPSSQDFDTPSDIPNSNASIMSPQYKMKYQDRQAVKVDPSDSAHLTTFRDPSLY